MNVAIIGGGLGGLVLAWRLQQAGIAYTVFEAENRPGGGAVFLLTLPRKEAA